MKKDILFITVFILSISSFGQRYNIGDYLKPTKDDFKLISISSQTNVHHYQYIGKYAEKIFYGREIGDISIGVKNDKIVTTIYNLIPNKNDIQIPADIIEAFQKTIPFPLAYQNGIYGVNIDNKTITISRTNNPMTFKKDRIMLLTSIKQSILRQ